MPYIKELWEISKGKTVEIDEDEIRALEERNKSFYNAANDKTVYGYNTGLGPLANIRLSERDLREFQVLTVRSHAVSTGKPLPIPIVRAGMYVRLRHLLNRSSGVRPVVVKRLAEFLNMGITPEVYEFGSVGASGDLSPLSHIALTLMGEGWVYLKNGNRVPSIVAHRMYKLEPLEFEPREALALINGYSFSLSNLGLALYKIEKTFNISIEVFVLSWKSIKGRKSPLNPDAVGIMGDKYAKEVSQKVWNLIEDEGDGERVQDPYSFRCFPQIASPLLRAIKSAEGLFSELYKGCSDNPVFVNGDIYSTGNFHGQSISFASDMLSSALTAYMGAIERRVFFMLSEKSGLPLMLSENPGKESGLMMLQTALASLFAECKVLSTPYSYQSIPTGNDQEDWVPMSFGATLRLLKLSDIMLKFVSAEFLCSYKALKVSGKREKIMEEFEEYLPQYRKNLSLYEEWDMAERFIRDKSGII
ncbi:MAG: aromatic amino acid ammonia-lyase [candidate division WOR-3 bacterium]